MFNISSAKVEDRSFTREGASREQNFNFKYRAKKGGHDFTFSNEYALALGIAESTGAIIPSYEDDKVVGVAIAILPDGHDAGRMFVKSKNPKFNNALLEQYLAEAGVIEVGESAVGKSQKLELTEYEETIDIKDGGIVSGKNKLYVIEASAEEAEAEVEEVAEEVEA